MKKQWKSATPYTDEWEFSIVLWNRYNIWLIEMKNTTLDLATHSIGFQISDLVVDFLCASSVETQDSLKAAILKFTKKIYKLFEGLLCNSYADLNTFRQIMYLAKDMCWCRVDNFSIGFYICHSTLSVSILEVKDAKYINNFDIMNLPEV